MSSLRARVLASVLVLAAIGMVAVAAVTYAEQRSFLYSRVDDQARGAIPYMSRLLDSKGFGVGSGTPFPGDGPGHDFHGAPPGFNPPPGTYGQRRNAMGNVIGHESFSYG
jgi:two-component system OmpR family sensor kinase